MIINRIPNVSRSKNRKNLKSFNYDLLSTKILTTEGGNFISRSGDLSQGIGRSAKVFKGLRDGEDFQTGLLLL